MPRRQRWAKLCFYLCSDKSHLPIRDVCNHHGKGNKLEPHYEDGTYNVCADCNQRSVSSAVRDGLSHLFFVTRYCGSDANYRNRYAIVGYYEIGETACILRSGAQQPSIAVRARRMVFVPIDGAFEITEARWRLICPHSKNDRPTNLRQITQRIYDNGDGQAGLVSTIIEWLDQHEVTDQFVAEVIRLNPGPSAKGGIVCGSC